MEQKEYSIDLGGRPLSFRFLNWTEQAHGSLLVTYGDTVVLTTAVMGSRDQNIPYFPLTVEYREKYYAAGKIGGGRFNKRESRPSDEATLKARLVDRALRPLFNHAIRRDVQVVNTILSYDHQNEPDVLALLGSSLALYVSQIPWGGPIASVRVGRVDGDWVLNPSLQMQEKSDLNLTLAGAEDKINMIEVGSNEVSEKDVTEAIAFGSKYLAQLVDLQNKIQKEIGQEKIEIELYEASNKLKKEVEEFAHDRMKEALTAKGEREEKTAALNKDLKEHITKIYENEEDVDRTASLALDYIDKMGDGILHELALKENKRVDGRKMDEIRPLSATVGVLPRTHGSAVFMRGLTHALSVATLASPGNEELHDDMEGESKKAFMHHYNFPPYSTGETGFFRGAGRREIGHGALAEKALRTLIPDQEEFPYVIRLVSEILSSNGSSSMASVCGSSLALMDAGIPIKGHIAGVAMGLISSAEGDYKVLTDIQGPEDHHGDMDLKVAGTRDGITAMQMDVKIEGMSLKILEDAIGQAKKAREEILTVLEGAIAQPREGLSPYAPMISVVTINPEKIGMVIGSGGKTIKEIMAQTETEINVEDDGRVFISGLDQEKTKRAVQWVEQITHEFEVGEIVKARVVRVVDFGAFVELAPGQDALVHVSELKADYVKDVNDAVKLGDMLEVKIINVDDQGKISASAKQVEQSKNADGENTKPQEKK